MLIVLNQFNLWHADDTLGFRKVAYINNYMDEGVRIQNPVYTDYKVTIIDSLPVMNDILINTRFRKIEVNASETVDLKVILSSKIAPENYRDAGDYSTRLHAGLYKGENLMDEEVCTLPLDFLLKRFNGEYNFNINAPAQKGSYKILISLNTSKIGIWSIKKTVNLIVR